MRNKRLVLKDILTALDRIDSYTNGMNYEAFVADEKTANAVIYNFLVIGEAVKMLPQTVTDNSPEIPWRQIVGMRDKLTHCMALSRIFLIPLRNSWVYEICMSFPDAVKIVRTG